MKWLLLLLASSLGLASNEIPQSFMETHCAPLGDLIQRRTVPPLSPQLAALNPKLTQLLVVTRHGARAPLGNNRDCWEDFHQTWNCDIGEISGAVSGSGQNMRSEKPGPSKVFKKRYDAQIGDNELRGSCELGQLLKEGAEQHLRLGEVLATAYFSDSSSSGNVYKHQLISLEEWRSCASLEEYIRFRVTDTQRTRLSGEFLMTGLMKTAYNGMIATSSVTLPLMHTLDAASDALSEASPQCQKIKTTVFASDEYRALHARHQQIINKLQQRIGTKPKFVWPSRLLDCIETTACHPDRFPHGLPAALVQDTSFFDETLEATGEEWSFTYKWNDGQLSKAITKEMVAEMRHSILQLQCPGCSTFEDWWQVRSAHNAKDDIYDMTQATGRRFMLWSAHDVSIAAFLTVLGAYDSKPPYASMVNVEIYSTEDGRSGFRLIYNSKDITNRIRNCTNETLCPLSEFFAVTDWVNGEATKEFAVVS